MLYHVSELAGIAAFEPRWSDAQNAAIVWAVHKRRLHNYLLPRECPRVCYTASEQTTAKDADQFLGSSQAVVAVESQWVERLQSTTLYLMICQPKLFASVTKAPDTTSASSA